MDNKYTQFPNYLLAKVYASSDLTLRETKVFLYLVRKLFGFHKDKDKIPYTQIANATGIDRRNAIKVIKSLEEKGYISVTRKGKSGNIIRIKGSVSRDTSTSVKNDNIVVSVETPSKEIQKGVSSNTHPLGGVVLEKKEKSYAELMAELEDDDEYV